MKLYTEVMHISNKVIHKMWIKPLTIVFNVEK